MSARLLTRVLMIIAVLATSLGFGTAADAGTCRRVTIYTGAGYDPYVDVCEP